MTRSLYTFPSWFYNALPFCYLLAGVLADLLIDGWIGTLIGVALVLLACSIWWQRYTYRKVLELSEEHLFETTILTSDDLPTQGLVQMSWSKAFECGHPVIDGQHRHLFGLANETINRLLAKQPPDVEENLLKRLISQLAEHFATEEALLAQAGDTHLDSHKSEHLALLETSKSLLKRFTAAEAISRELVSFLSDQVICGHIIKEDLHTLASIR